MSSTTSKVTLGEKLTVLKERLLNGRSSNEAEEFLTAYGKLLKLRKQLKMVEKGIQDWLKNSKALSQSAIYLARAVDTESEVFLRLTTDMHDQLEDQSTLRAISKKIGMLDRLVKDREDLVVLRHLRNRRVRKVRKALAKPDVDEETRNNLTKQEEAAAVRYDEAYAQLLASIRFVVGEADKNGHCSLIAPELAAFKLEQFQFFLNCQKIIQGSEKDDAKNLNDEWLQFSEQLTTERNEAKKSVETAYMQELSHSLQKPQEQKSKDEEEEDDVEKRPVEKHRSIPQEDRKSRIDQEETFSESEDDEDDYSGDEGEEDPITPQSLGSPSKPKAHGEALRERLGAASPEM